MTTPTTVTCPTCRSVLKLKSRSQLGRERDCPRCGYTFVLQAIERPVKRKRSNQKPRSQKRRSHQRSTNPKVILAGGTGLFAIVLIGVFLLSDRGDETTDHPESQVTSVYQSTAPPVPPSANENAPVAQENSHIKIAAEPETSFESEDSIKNVPPQTNSAVPMETSEVASQITSNASTEEPIRTQPVRTEPIDFKPDQQTFVEVISPFLRTHCLRCHGPETTEGNFRVDKRLPNEFLDRSIVADWSEVLNMLNSGEMPPAGEPQPSQPEAQRVVEWIEVERLRAERARKDRTIVLRRMNRHEYNNTIRDLIGIDLDLVDEFPEDPPAGGFDNNGSALTLSPQHLELYLKTAQKILDRAIVDIAERPETVRWHFELEDGAPGAESQRVRLDNGQNQNVRINCGDRPPVQGMVLHRHRYDESAVRYFTVPEPGQYIIRVRAAAKVPPEEAVRKAGVDIPIQKQEVRESNISDPEERRRSRVGFEKWSLPGIRKHFAEDRRYQLGPPRMRIFARLGAGRETLAEFDVTAPLEEPEVYEIIAFLTPVNSSIMLSNQYTIPGHWFLGMNWREDAFPTSELYIDWMEIEGPVYDDWPPTSHQRILIDSPKKDRNEVAYARDVLANFMQRAYRRPLREGELESKVRLFQSVRHNRPTFAEAIKVPLMAVLSSPNFLFLVEENESQPLNGYELASRLSYFLWSSMPDEELFRLAESGDLKNSETLRNQVERMLTDQKSSAFVKNFTGQWLDLRKVGTNAPVREIYMRYDDHLEVSMRGETEAFFDHILRTGQSALDFIKSDYVTINERLARFYEIDGIRGDHFRAVPVPAGVPRGGIVTQASMLAVTSNGTRTSPVWRGAWVLENLLDDRPAPPPPNAGDIPPSPEGEDKLTVRQRLQSHREHAQCARCHNKIDPLGFALENFAATGEWRDKEHRIYMDKTTTAGPAIDSSAQMPDGTQFVGVEGLQQELLKRQDQFLTCLAKQLYTYALGRELTYSDEPVVADAVQTMKANDCTLRSLIHHIVKSDLFRTK